MGNYTVRRMLPEDAPGIAGLTKAVWGDSYPVPMLYNPENIIEEDRTGRNISIVAVDESGGVVAHDALENPEKGGVGECGQAMVHPDHQGQGLMFRTRTLVVDTARELGLAGVYGQPVTTHTKSQKTYEKMGFKIVGATPAWLPENINSCGSDPISGRKSLLMYFMKLGEMEERKVYVPERQKDIVQEIYSSLGISVRFESGTAEKLSTTQDIPRITGLTHLKSKCIRFGKLTPDSVPLFKGIRIEPDDEAVVLEFPFSCSEAVRLAAAAEKAGFIFAGIGIAFLCGTDIYRMIKIREPINTAALHIENPMALRIIKNFQQF